MNTAIIVAAGSGKRFGGDTPKQFLKIHGKPLLDYTVARFLSCESVDSIVLVLAHDQIGTFEGVTTVDQSRKPFEIVAGGDSRAESVSKGLARIRARSLDVVAVHDGARPLVTSEEISETIAAAKKNGAACLVGAVTDTIKEVENSKIVRTVNRKKLRRALTPQCFQYELLKKAFDENEIDEIATDECFLVEKLGYEIAIVEGSSKNIKVTTREDMEFVEKVLERLEIKDV